MMVQQGSLQGIWEFTVVTQGTYSIIFLRFFMQLFSSKLPKVSRIIAGAIASLFYGLSKRKNLHNGKHTEMFGKSANMKKFN